MMTPQRRQLIDALRGELPSNFKWRFSVTIDDEEGCGTAGCAMGLAQFIGLIEDAYDYREIMQVFGLTEDQFDHIFFSHGYKYVRDITPQMVADALEKLGD